MNFERPVIVKPAATKPPAARPDTRSTLRDLNSARVLGVFRRKSFIQRVLEAITGPARDREL